MEIKNTKYKIGDDKELCKRVQEALFKWGAHWNDDSTTVSFLEDAKELYCEEDYHLTYSSVINSNNFSSDRYRELKIEDLLKEKMPKPQEPKFVVIWEEDSDPAKLFATEKDAKDFIKRLYDNSNVKKDSIMIAELKSCKKVKMNKQLKFTNHKI